MTIQNVVVVTGAVGNLCLATARAFQRAGYKNVLVDRSQDRLSKAFADLTSSSSPDHWLAGGIGLSKPAVVEKLAADTVARFDWIDECSSHITRSVIQALPGPVGC